MGFPKNITLPSQLLEIFFGNRNETPGLNEFQKKKDQQAAATPNPDAQLVIDLIKGGGGTPTPTPTSLPSTPTPAPTEQPTIYNVGLQGDTSGLEALDSDRRGQFRRAVSIASRKEGITWGQYDALKSFEKAMPDKIEAAWILLDISRRPNTMAPPGHKDFFEFVQSVLEDPASFPSDDIEQGILHGYSILVNSSPDAMNRVWAINEILKQGNLKKQQSVAALLSGAPVDSRFMTTKVDLWQNSSVTGQTALPLNQWLADTYKESNWAKLYTPVSTSTPTPTPSPMPTTVPTWNQRSMPTPMPPSMRTPQPTPAWNVPNRRLPTPMPTSTSTERGVPLSTPTPAIGGGKRALYASPRFKIGMAFRDFTNS